MGEQPHIGDSHVLWLLCPRIASDRKTRGHERRGFSRTYGAGLERSVFLELGTCLHGPGWGFVGEMVFGRGVNCHPHRHYWLLDRLSCPTSPLRTQSRKAWNNLSEI